MSSNIKRSGSSQRGQQAKRQKTVDLMWRDDPIESFSDWKILIHPEDGSGTDTYHVHRNIIARGPRKSTYFVNIFKMGGKFRESTERASKIPLSTLAAKAFPTFLDFIYGAPLKVETNTATPLYDLGQYFGCPALCQEVARFCQNDASAKNEAIYESHAKEFHFDALLSTAKKEIGRQKEVAERKRKESFAYRFSEFLEDVVEEPILQQRCQAILDDLAQNGELPDDASLPKNFAKWFEPVLGKEYIDCFVGVHIASFPF